MPDGLETAKLKVGAAAAAFLRDMPKRLLIGGEWVPARSGATFETIDPATAQAIGRAAAGDAADVDDAVRAARAAFEAPSWSAMPPHQRARLLLRIADSIDAHRQELAEIEAIDNGTPLSIALQAVAGVAETFVYFSGWVTKIYGETNPSAPSILNYTLREPVGVCGQIVPWNGPLTSAAWKLAPALAMGNTVILKPAEQTPLSSVRLAEIMVEAGLPAGVLNLITGFGETAGAAIAAHGDIDKVAFTGSTEVGKKILAASAGNLKRVTLELGGKSPNIVFADADLDAAAGASALGFCFLAGQICVAASRMLVHEDVHDAFAEKLAAAAASLAIGDPFEASTLIGPLVSREQMERVRHYVEIGQGEGARLAGGGAIAGPGYFLRPVIFSGVRPDMRIAREEIFGPVTTLIPFRDEEEAVRLANDSSFGLAAAIWSRDGARAHRVAKRLRAGTVWINTYLHTDLISPFGGYKQSGIGRELGRHALDAYTEVKSIYANLA